MRAAICFIYGFVFTMANEIFPPEVRSQSCGISEIFATFGGMLSPPILLLAERYQINALFVFGTLGIPALISARYIPEGIISDLEEKDDAAGLDYMQLKEQDKNKTSISHL